MMNYIKRSLALLLVTAISLLGLAACGDETMPSDPGVSSDNSYVGVNYTDTGDTNNSAQSIGHIDSQATTHSVLSEISADINKAQSEAAATAAESPKAQTSSSSSNNERQSTTTKTVITYYFPNENDETAPDTEAQPQTQTDSSQTESVKETDSASSDSETDTSVISDTDTTEDTDSSLPVSAGEFTADDLTLTINGIPVTFGTDIAQVEAAIGEPLSVDDTVSGEDPDVVTKKMYNFESLCIDTVLSEDETCYEIIGIQIFDDFISTDKGLHVGMTFEDAISIYGESMMVYGDYYRYYIDNKYMYLYIANDLVANIGYSIDKEVQTDD